MGRRPRIKYKTVDAVIDAFDAGIVNVSDFTRLLRHASEYQAHIAKGFLPDRPPRSMPTMKALLRYLDHPEGICFKCQAEVDYLERAHVIDRVGDGLDNEANLRPLCVTCHRLQPAFVNGQEAEAEVWFNDHRSPLLDILSPGVGHSDCLGTSRSETLRVPVR